jgi:hypothetical protein
MVGTFWTMDALFAFANAGALGFHLHWGRGGEPSGDNPPSVGVQTNFILKVMTLHLHQDLKLTFKLCCIVALPCLVIKMRMTANSKAQATGVM